MKKHNINSGRLFFLSLFEDGSVYTVERERTRCRCRKLNNCFFSDGGKKKGEKKRASSAFEHTVAYLCILSGKLSQYTSRVPRNNSNNNSRRYSHFFLRVMLHTYRQKQQQLTVLSNVPLPWKRKEKQRPFYISVIRTEFSERDEEQSTVRNMFITLISFFFFYITWLW